MKCEDCGTKQDVRNVKHLPLPDGSNGWITLTEWTRLCPTCIRKRSAAYDELIEAVKTKFGREQAEGTTD